MAASTPGKNTSRDREPDGLGLLRMAWSQMLFLHWPIDPAPLRSCLPAGLEPDLFDAKAWITVMPFRMTGVRPVLTPAVPGLSSSLEVNVRTCVTHRGERGIFFFSLDASNALGVWLARTFFHLPYFRARIQATRRGETFRFVSSRTHQGASAAKFECTWTARQPLPPARRGELTHFLTERPILFHVHREKIYRGHVSHESWSLREARIGTLHSTMVEAAGLPSPVGAPIAHHCDQLAVCVSGIQEISTETANAALLEPALSPPPASFTH